MVDGTGEIAEATKITYTYDNGVWKDLLASYDGQTITYDAQGNPTNYLGHTLTWEKGRQLKSFIKSDGTAISYTYNANGIRTSKTINGITHTYTLDGAKILRESWGGNTLIPLYDNEDSVCGITYNNTPYYFLKNLQGDVIAITNADGETVARYTYDAWGVCAIASDTSGRNIATVNPFRYRGYYYDSEIGMYYLQSRYYNPIIGRFVNGDAAEMLAFTDIINCLNYYSYCNNDAINNIDKDGCRRYPKLVAFGFQIEISISFAEYGLEVVFANGCAYMFVYGGTAYSGTLNSILKKLSNCFVGMFSASKFRQYAKELFSANLSLCVFAVFSSVTNCFNPYNYEGRSWSVGVTIPTFYNASIKTYTATWDTYYIAVGAGFSFPRSCDISATYCTYKYKSMCNYSAAIRNFVNSKSRGLNP